MDNKNSAIQYDKKLQTDLTVYLHFLNLYKKRRPKELMQQIEQIVSNENSIIMRINKIEELDEQHKNTKKIETKKIIKEKYNENVTKTKNYGIISPSSFIGYFFFERPKLINFGKKTETISFTLLGLKKELSAHAIVFWHKLIEDILKTLLPQVRYIIINGWQLLEPVEYNLIKAINNFLKKLLKVATALDRNKSNFTNLSIIDSFIDSYIRIISNSSYPNLIETSFCKLINTSEEYNNKLKDSMSVIKKFTNMQNNEMSFLNICISCYAICYNRVITIDNISRSYKVKPINSEYHEFDGKTLDSVKKYINKVDKEIADGEDTLFFIKFIDEELNFGSNIKNKWVDLFYNLVSYDKIIGNSTRQKADKDGMLKPFYNDILKYLVKFTEVLLKTYLIVLGENIKIIIEEQPKKVSIFTNSLFKNELTTLKNLIEDYQHMYKHSRVMAIPFKTYNSFQVKGQLGSEKENSLCQVIEDTLLAYKTISFNLYKVLLQHHKASQEPSGELIEKYKTQNDPIGIIEKNDKRFIPYSFNIVSNYELIENQKVIDVLNQIVFFCLNLLYLLKEKDVIQSVSDKEQLIIKMEDYFRLKAKIK